MLTIVEALAIATGRTPGSQAAAFRVISAALGESWLLTRLKIEAPPNTDADDIRQKVMLDLLKSGRPFEGTTEEQAHKFLGTIAVRRAIDTDRARRRHEVKVSEDSFDRLPTMGTADEAVIASDLERRIEQLVETAATLATSPTSETLYHHLRLILLGRPLAPGNQMKVSAKLRQERSRSLSLLRRAHEACISTQADLGRPDELDWVIERLLETPKTLKSRSDEE
ncbi:MAG: hypothetical protein QM831_31545 [Kofleriaceae bacterium]